jgi:signal transduction histidine kinase
MASRRSPGLSNKDVAMNASNPVVRDRSRGAYDGQWAWFQEVLNLLPVPAALIEQGSGRVLFANRAAERVPIAPPIGGGDGVASEAFDAEGQPIADDEIPARRAARGARLEGVPVIWRTPEGTASFLVFAEPMSAWPGTPPVTLLSFVDVTQRTAVEAELRRAVQARDEFFSVATHELKDPLAAMLLSVEVLERAVKRHGTVPAELLLAQIEVCRRQGERLSRLIGDFLQVARIAHKRLQLDLEALDLCELARDVAAQFREQARASGTSLDVEAEAPTIGYWDRVKLEHVVGNLVSNALKYGAGRPVTVRVRADEATATVEVEDRGIGIAEADQRRIFERFERATDGHATRSLGLGLYIVHSIVEAHGGAVQLRSAPGEGSTFTVALPRKRMPAPPERCGGEA